MKLSPRSRTGQSPVDGMIVCFAALSPLNFRLRNSLSYQLASWSCNYLEWRQQLCLKTDKNHLTAANIKSSRYRAALFIALLLWSFLKRVATWLFPCCCLIWPLNLIQFIKRKNSSQTQQVYNNNNKFQPPNTISIFLTTLRPHASVLFKVWLKSSPDSAGAQFNPHLVIIAVAVVIIFSSAVHNYWPQVSQIRGFIRCHWRCYSRSMIMAIIHTIIIKYNTQQQFPLFRSLSLSLTCVISWSNWMIGVPELFSPTTRLMNERSSVQVFKWAPNH